LRCSGSQDRPQIEHEWWEHTGRLNRRDIEMQSISFLDGRPTASGIPTFGLEGGREAGARFLAWTKRWRQPRVDARGRVGGVGPARTGK
jgi:hypothetical protein